MDTEQNKRINFSDLFDTEDILCHTSITGRDELIMDMLKCLAYNHGIGNVHQAYEAVIEREASQSTIISTGIAMPHARLDGLERPLLAIATSRDGIDFEEGKDAVNLVILTLIPKEQPAVYLQILSSLGRCCSDKETAGNVSALDSEQKVRLFFQREGMVLPDYICAGDIMAPRPVTLKETDCLKDAIDLFVARDLTTVPVVDKEGDIIGVVTAHALMRVCLPDYILWMDDLSPIINFEPFTNVLRNEKNTWLAEIMTHDVTTVEVDSPAIHVAEEITKNQAGQCYVVRGSKLVGVITLQQFLNKIFRE